MSLAIQQVATVNSGSSSSNSERSPNRLYVFDKMEELIREMHDQETGVPMQTKKFGSNSQPCKFIGNDLIQWLMERLSIEESEAFNLANLFCSYGYFYPTNDPKNLTVKDVNTAYRFQLPCYWPGKIKNPDNIEYATYLLKRFLRNKQRHGGLEDYELESLNSLKKNLQNKFDFITIQAEEQIKNEKDLNKDDKLIKENQEKAFWRVHRPPPKSFNILDQFPIQNKNKDVPLTIREIKQKLNLVQQNLQKVRIKVSQALESFVIYVVTYTEFDPFITGTQPQNPWTNDDVEYWQLNSPLVEVASIVRVKRWALSMEELVTDPTGLREFTIYLRKEYSHENIRFWLTVSSFRHSPQSQVIRKVHQIYQEFLARGAPCEINIDGKTMEIVQKEMQNPSRFTFDAAAKHVYDLLLKKDCYPRFVRSDHYKNLIATGTQMAQKKRDISSFFSFGPAKKKNISATAASAAAAAVATPTLAPSHLLTSSLSLPPPSQSSQLFPHNSSSSSGAMSAATSPATATAIKPITIDRSHSQSSHSQSSTIRKRASDLSLTASAQEVTVSKTADCNNAAAGNISVAIGTGGGNQSNVPHSHSQKNLTDISLRASGSTKSSHSTAQSTGSTKETIKITDENRSKSLSQEVESTTVTTATTTLKKNDDDNGDGESRGPSGRDNSDGCGSCTRSSDGASSSLNRRSSLSAAFYNTSTASSSTSTIATKEHLHHKSSSDLEPVTECAINVSTTAADAPAVVNGPLEPHDRTGRQCVARNVSTGSDMSQSIDFDDNNNTSAAVGATAKKNKQQTHYNISDENVAKKAPLAEPEAESSTGADFNLDFNDKSTVCPWEAAEKSNNSDEAFVKTYATLGYL